MARFGGVFPLLRKVSMGRLLVGSIGLVLLAAVLGCVETEPVAGDSAGQRPQTKDGGYYARKYAEKAIARHYAGESSAEYRVTDIRKDGRNWLAEVIVTQDGKAEKRRLVLDRNGGIVEEKPQAEAEPSVNDKGNS